MADWVLINEALPLMDGSLGSVESFGWSDCLIVVAECFVDCILRCERPV